MLMRSSVVTLVPGSVAPSPDNNVKMLWSRCQDRLMRLNVRLSTLKSVPNPEVVMEIKMLVLDLYVIMT